MKKIFFLLAFIFIYQLNIFSQFRFEIGGGYLVQPQSGTLFLHNNNGWQVSGSLLYDITSNIELNGSLVYQSRQLNPNSFSFVIPALAGLSIPVVTGGDNLNAYGISLSGRLKSAGESLLNSFISVDLALMYYQESYYALRSLAELGIRTIVISPQKYSDDKFLFESSFGLGVMISPMNMFDLIIEGKFSYIPNEREVYFPLSTKIRIDL